MALYAAPFLGAQHIPFFQPLVDIFPEEDRNLLVPTSSVLVGLVALAIQFYAGEAVTRRGIRRFFGPLIVSVCVGLLVLPLVHVRQVKKVKNLQLGTVASVVIGWSRLPRCPCKSPSNQACLGEIVLELEQCWDADSIFSVKATMFLLYLLAIQGFAGLAGLIVLRENKKHEPKAKKPTQRRRRRKPAAPAAAEPSPPAEAAPKVHPAPPPKSATQPASRRPSRRKSPSAPPKS